MGLAHNLDTNIFRILTATPSNPSAGAQLSWPCPDRSRVHILGIHISYVVANSGSARLVVIAGYDGTNNFCESPLADIVGINDSHDLFFALEVDARDHEATHNILTGELSSGIYLDPGDSLVTLIDALAGADQISNVFIRYRQWIMSQ